MGKARGGGGLATAYEWEAGMKIRFAVTGFLTLGFVLLGAGPSPERPVGWRGDNTGRYEASPPVEWSRQAKTTLTEMTAQAKKPSDGAGPAGTVLRRMRGSFAATEWLVLGPVSSPLGDKVLEKEAIVGEGAFAPGEGERVGELAWKAAPASGRGVDLAGLFGKLDEDHVAYLCTYFFRRPRRW